MVWWLFAAKRPKKWKQLLKIANIFGDFVLICWVTCDLCVDLVGDM